MVENSRQRSSQGFEAWVATLSPTAVESDRRVFLRFALSDRWEDLHFSTVAADSLRRSITALDSQAERTRKRIDSKLLTPDATAEQTDLLALQQERVAILRELLVGILEERSERLAEIDRMEREFTRRETANRRKEIAAKKPDKKAGKQADKQAGKQAAEQRLEPHEEAKPPGSEVLIDMNLFDKAAEALRLSEQEPGKQDTEPLK